MKVLENLSNPKLGKQMLDRVKETAGRLVRRLGRPALLMEVCGTHTTAISRLCLRQLLEGLVELRSGPGCPVCVTGTGDIEQMIVLSRLSGVTVATFGDMLRVPGGGTSLELERARGAVVKMVYSPVDAVELARINTDREVVFLGVGFETTAPLAALCVKQAADLGLDNFSIYSAHKILPSAIRALLGGGGIQVDGFILPGHVCAVTGTAPFAFIGKELDIPAVVAGFTPVDILDALYLLLNNILEDKPELVNGYRWVVKDGGNANARRAMEECFDSGDALWRGFGNIPQSGLYLKKEFSRFDACVKFGVKKTLAMDPDGCRCGELLRGLIKPTQCAFFGRSCTPANPVGPCMVSSEGACAAFYRYEQRGRYHDPVRK